MKILSVDDSKTIRLVVARAFSSFDCEVSQAVNGEDGLAKAAAEKPDLILLDLTMPVMDGATMVVKLQEDPTLKNIPVIMLTAESGSENVACISQLGVRDYLVKPFKDDQLIEKATRLIALKKKAA